MSGILDKCVFVIDQFIPLKKKVELIRMIKTNGGISVYSVSEKSTHLVTSHEGFLDGSAKVQSAKNLGLHIVSKEFVIDSIARGEKQDESNYNFSNMEQQAPTSPTSPTTPMTIPALTVTIPTRPANSPLSSTSPRSPPGFNNFRAPNQQPLNVGDKKGFGRLRVDVNNKGHPSPQPTPSPKSPVYATSESAHTEDEDDDDDDDEDDENSSDDDEPGKPSFRDALEHSNNKQPRAWESATPQYGLEDDGCKIFVGGIMFDDLEALKKTKDGYSASEEVIAHIQKLKNERLIEIIRIFSRFGTVVRVKQFLEKRHIFITYDNKNSALQALRALKPLEVRKKIVQEIRERLRAEDRQTLVSPRSNFYVRWPHHVESEDGGYSSNSRSYFSSGSSAPSSPTAASSIPTHKLSWRQPQPQPQSPTTSAYTPYQRSYFTQNNFVPASRSSSMRSYFSNSESDYEASNNLNSFSESESTQYSRTARTQHYQQHAQAHGQPPQRTADTIAKTVLSESDSDSPTGIRHRVIDRSLDRTQDSSTPTSSSPNPSTTSSSTSPAQAEPSALPTPTSTPSSTPSTHKRVTNEEGNWQRVLVLLLIIASMAIVYLYNK